jgi:hypothetical protein
MQIPVRVFLLAGVFLFPCDSAGQTRVSDSDQRNIELAVATHLMATRPPAPAGVALKDLNPRFGTPVWVGRNFALEPLLLLSGLRFTPQERPAFRYDPPVLPTGEPSSAHTASHLSQLSAVLQISSILDTSKTCPFSADNLACRYERYEGYVQMGSAWLRGDIAEIVVWAGEKPAAKSGDPVPPMRAVRWFCKLRQNEKDAWSVSDCNLVQA